MFAHGIGNTYKGDRRQSPYFPVAKSYGAQLAAAGIYAASLLGDKEAPLFGDLYGENDQKAARGWYKIGNRPGPSDLLSDTEKNRYALQAYNGPAMPTTRALVEYTGVSKPLTEYVNQYPYKITYVPTTIMQMTKRLFGDTITYETYTQKATVACVILLNLLIWHIWRNKKRNKNRNQLFETLFQHVTNFIKNINPDDTNDDALIQNILSLPGSHLDGMEAKLMVVAFKEAMKHIRSQDIDIRRMIKEIEMLSLKLAKEEELRSHWGTIVEIDELRELMKKRMVHFDEKSDKRLAIEARRERLKELEDLGLGGKVRGEGLSARFYQTLPLDVPTLTLPFLPLKGTNWKSAKTQHLVEEYEQKMRILTGEEEQSLQNGWSELGDLALHISETGSVSSSLDSTTSSFTPPSLEKTVIMEK